MGVLLLLPLLNAFHDCTQWNAPLNPQDYPKWPYCNKRPGDGQTRFKFVADNLPPMDKAPYQCKDPSKVLNADSMALLCVNYKLGGLDGFGGDCDDAQCCVPQKCDTYTCSAGWTTRTPPENINCHFECNDEQCCNAPDGIPSHHAQGLLFVDRDGRYANYGGTVTIFRANDESDITHYVLYWGYAYTGRKGPSCGVNNPVSWNEFKYKGSDKIGEYPVTGCDIKVELPMGTKPGSRCPPKQSPTSRGGSDTCTAQYLIVATKNAKGERPVTLFGGQGPGPNYPLADYESTFGLPCMEGGIAYGHDLPGKNDIVIGRGVSNPKDCQQLCKDYPEKDASGNPNPGWPCRWWQWTYPTGGPTSSKCWIDAQVIQRQRYGVRFGGPAVCSTPNDAAPAGDEWPLCTRWVRYPNTVFNTGGGPYARQLPVGGVLPLGPFENQEMCQAQCQMTPTCIGFSFRKRDPGHVYFHKCILHYKDETRASDNQFDSWLCSRETQAPLLHGFELQPHPFGYQKCTVEAAGETVPTIECCASKCDDTCSHFTYYATGRCVIHTSCVLEAISNVQGCAYESCFLAKGHGAATYLRQPAAVEIVDRWPLADTPADGLKVGIQTQFLEGKKVACIARNQKGGTAFSGTTYSQIKGLAGAREGVISDSLALLMITTTVDNVALDIGQTYDLRCGVEGFGYADGEQKTVSPVGYYLLGDGYCRATGKGETGKGMGAGHTVAECQAICDQDAACKAFWVRHSDGWCSKRTIYDYDYVNKNALIQCFRKGSGVNVHDIGNGDCAKACDGTCRVTPRRMGDFTRNAFMPTLTYTSASCPVMPTLSPSASPTTPPAASPTLSPNKSPTASPRSSPTRSPAGSPTTSPIMPTTSPQFPPTTPPTASPTASPRPSPTRSPLPAGSPTTSPIVPTTSPRSPPTTPPTASPTASPRPSPTRSPLPAGSPTTSPIVPTTSPQSPPTPSPRSGPAAPTAPPQVSPTASPQSGVARPPTTSPTSTPSPPPLSPTMSPNNPSVAPSIPTALPPPTKAPLAPLSPTTPPNSPLPTPSKAPYTPDSPSLPPRVAVSPPTARPAKPGQAPPTIAPSVSLQGSPTVMPSVQLTMVCTEGQGPCPDKSCPVRSAPTEGRCSDGTIVPLSAARLIPTASPDASSDASLSSAMIVLLVAGALAICGLFAGLLWWRNKRKKRCTVAMFSPDAGTLQEELDKYNALAPTSSPSPRYSLDPTDPTLFDRPQSGTLLTSPSRTGESVERRPSKPLGSGVTVTVANMSPRGESPRSSWRESPSAGRGAGSAPPRRPSSADHRRPSGAGTAGQSNKVKSEDLISI
eukprot:Hpha_TRINITY_DN13656_c0_g2::TRINITY_DN13656_c0_g2_i2::g.122600::m.122600